MQHNDGTSYIISKSLLQSAVLSDQANSSAEASNSTSAHEEQSIELELSSSDDDEQAVCEIVESVSENQQRSMYSIPYQSSSSSPVTSNQPSSAGRLLTSGNTIAACSSISLIDLLQQCDSKTKFNRASVSQTTPIIPASVPRAARNLGSPLQSASSAHPTQLSSSSSLLQQQSSHTTGNMFSFPTSPQKPTQSFSRSASDSSHDSSLPPLPLVYRHLLEQHAALENILMVHNSSSFARRRVPSAASSAPPTSSSSITASIISSALSSMHSPGSPATKLPSSSASPHSSSNHISNSDNTLHWCPSRQQHIPFPTLREQVERVTKHRFNLQQLAQILYVLPDDYYEVVAITLRDERLPAGAHEHTYALRMKSKSESNHNSATLAAAGAAHHQPKQRRVIIKSAEITDSSFDPKSSVTSSSAPSATSTGLSRSPHHAPPSQATAASFSSPRHPTSSHQSLFMTPPDQTIIPLLTSPPLSQYRRTPSSARRKLNVGALSGASVTESPLSPFPQHQAPRFTLSSPTSSIIHGIIPELSRSASSPQVNSSPLKSQLLLNRASSDELLKSSSASTSPTKASAFTAHFTDSELTDRRAEFHHRLALLVQSQHRNFLEFLNKQSQVQTDEDPFSPPPPSPPLFMGSLPAHSPFLTHPISAPAVAAPFSSPVVSPLSSSSSSSILLQNLEDSLDFTRAHDLSSNWHELFDLDHATAQIPTAPLPSLLRRPSAMEFLNQSAMNDSLFASLPSTSSTSSSSNLLSLVMSRSQPSSPVKSNGSALLASSTSPSKATSSSSSLHPLTGVKRSYSSRLLIPATVTAISSQQKAPERLKLPKSGVRTNHLATAEQEGNDDDDEEVELLIVDEL